MQYHPDRNKEPGAEERFKEIAEAYAVLSEPAKRAEYDAGGLPQVGHFSAEDLFGGINFDDLFGGLGFDFGSSLFDRSVGRPRRGVPARGANLEVELRVSLQRVLDGGEEQVRVARRLRCETCQGSGAKPGTTPRECASCHGSGRAISGGRKGGVLFQRVSPCPDCDGRGIIVDQPCADCEGSGLAEKTDTLTVRVPRGVEEGMALRIPGHGLASEGKGGAPGDLYVVVHTAADPRFERDGSDLWGSEEISLSDAALGTERSVATLDGEVTIKIPPGTQPNSVLRLKGKGLPHFSDRVRGDLLLRLRVVVPEKLSAAQRDLFERLRELEGRGS